MTITAPTPAAPDGAQTVARNSTSGATVDVVLVVQDGEAWLGECLDALAAQSLTPRRVVVVDNASTDDSLVRVRAHKNLHLATEVRIEHLESRRPIGAALRHGVSQLELMDGASSTWVWLLHDAAPADPDVLSHLVARASRHDGIVGPKVVGWNDPRRLVELGIPVTRTGRRLGRPGRGEPDQGQHDDLTDVLAVRTSGLLVRTSVWTELGGIDRAFDRAAAGLDLGWRAHLAGYRVVVDPAARLRDATATEPPGQPFAPLPAAQARRERVGTRRVALARRSLLGSLAMSVWLAVSAVVLGLVLLLAKRPRQAAHELSDLTALARPDLVLGARWRGRRTRRARRTDLATLFVPAGASVREALRRVQDEVAPERTQAAPLPTGPVETGPIADEADNLAVADSPVQRALRHPGVLAVVVALAVSALAWRSLLGAGALTPATSGVTGGELNPLATNAAGLWNSFRDAWTGSGLGGPSTTGPGLAVLAALTWLVERLPGAGLSRSSAGLTVSWVLFLAPVLATWTAYLAARVVHRARGARAVGALAWGLGATVPAVSEARVGFAIAAVLLPLVAAGVVLAARRDGTWTATCATALAAALTFAFVPVWYVPFALACLGLVAVAPGLARLRGLVLLALPVALLGPWVERFVHDPTLLLSGPGLVQTGERPEPLALALVHPVPVSAPALWLTAPLVVLGLLGLALRAGSTRRRVGVAALSLLGLAGLGAALGAPRIVLGSAETSPGQAAAAGPWPGVGLALWLVLLASALVMLVGRVAPVTRWRGSRQRRALATGASLFVGLAVAATIAGSVPWVRDGAHATLSVDRATRPAVAIEQASGPMATRLLVLRPSATVVDYELVGREPGQLARDLDPSDPAAVSAPTTNASPTDLGLSGVVGDLVGRTGADAPDSARLIELGVGFVQAAVGPTDPLVARLDATEGLSRLGSDSTSVLWKVTVPTGVQATAPSRLRLTDAAGRLLSAVGSTGSHGATSTTLPAGPADRRLVVAEPTAWSAHAVVTLDDRVLEPVEGAAEPTYLVGAQGGSLRIDLAAAHPWWRLAQGVLLGAVVFLALPFGNRSSRRRR